MKINVLGACGTFMGGVARLAAAGGHEVTGCDAAFYEPMAGQLRAANINCQTGYPSELDKLEADLHIVGNVISRGNATLEAILAARAPFCSGPEWLAREVLGGVDGVISVAGTHGKTTTTSLVVHILDKCGRNPGYLVGGVPKPNAASASLGGGSCFVVEADEYDTSFCDKRPKFIHYWSKVTVLNNIEFDHADIYPDMAAVMRQFALLPRQIRPGGTLVANWADANVREVAQKQPWHSITRFNDPDALHWRDDCLYNGKINIGAAAALPPGEHNRSNALAAIAACAALGVSEKDALESLADFVLPARRLEVICEKGGIRIVDDFAHHPTAFRATIETLRGLYPDTRLLIAFEPRSNTMIAGCWQDDLADCLSGADLIFGLDTDLEWDLAQALSSLGQKATICQGVKQMRERLLGELCSGDTLALLSNGSFGGLRDDLPKAVNGST